MGTDTFDTSTANTMLRHMRPWIWSRPVDISSPPTTKLLPDHDGPRLWVLVFGMWEAGLGRPVVKLTVRRTHLFEDGLTSLMLKDCEVGFDGLCRSLCGTRSQVRRLTGERSSRWSS